MLAGVLVSALVAGEQQASAVAAVERTGTAPGARATTSAYATAVLADSPNAYWRLGELTGPALTDSSGAAVTATPRAGSTLGIAGALQAESDKALNGGFSAPDASLPSGSTARTVEAWFFGGTQAVSLQYGRVSSNDGFAVSVDPQAAQITVGGGDVLGSVVVGVPYAINDGAWHLLDASSDGTTVTVYLDGQPIGSSPLADLDTVVAGQSFKVEASQGIDEVAVYPKAVTLANLATRWSQGAAGAGACTALSSTAYPVVALADSPVAYYRLGEPSRTPATRVAFDASGRCADGAIASSALPIAGALTNDADTAIRGVIQAPAAALPSGAAARTVEAWLLGGQTGASLSYGDASTSDAFVISTDPSAGRMTISNGDTLGAVPLTTGRFDDGKWHLLDVALNAGKVTAYLDGRAVGSGPLGGLTTVTAGQALRVDAPLGVDEVAIYPTALTASTVGLHYLRGYDTAQAVVRGTVLAAGQPVPGALVQLCDGAGTCTQIFTDASGGYRFAVGYGTFAVKAFPPTSGVGSATLVTDAGATTSASAPYVQLDLNLTAPSLPSNSSLTSPTGGTVTSGQPTIFWQEPVVFKTQGCKNGFGFLTVSSTDQSRFVPLTESPRGSGNYVATIPPLAPMHGTGRVAPRLFCGPRVSLFPSGGTTSGGTSVLVRLSSTPAAAVTQITFGGKVGTSLSMGSSSTYSIVTPAGTGDVPVQVKLANGTSLSLGTFHYLSGTLSGSTEGPANGGATVTIKGTGFASNSTVTFNGRQSSSVNFVSSTELRAVAPPGSGTASVWVGAPNGASQVGSYNYTGTPELKSLLEWQARMASLGLFGVELLEALRLGPANVAVTVAVFLLGEIVGEELKDNETLKTWYTIFSIGAQAVGLATEGIFLPLLVLTIAVAIFYLLIDPSGTVVDKNGTPVAGASVVLSRQISGVMTPVPDGDQSIEPSTNPLTTGAAGTFAWETTAGTYDVSASSPACPDAGGIPVVVRTPVFTIPPEKTGIVLTLPCALATVAKPTVSGVTPSTVSVGGGDVVTVAGTGFTTASTVKVGVTSVAAGSITFLSPTSIQIKVPAGTGSADVVVSNSAGTSSTSSSDRVSFAPLPPKPSVQTVGRGALNFPVTFTGSAFTGVNAIMASATGVTFSSVAVAGNGTSVTAKMSVTSAVALGPFSLTLKRADGTSTACAACMTVSAAPTTVGTASPVSVTRGGTGATASLPMRLQAGGTIQVLSKPAIVVTVLANSGTAVIVKVSATTAATAGTYSLTAVNPDGGRATFTNLVVVS